MFVDHIVDNADKALYLSKSNGKNQVTLNKPQKVTHKFSIDMFFIYQPETIQR